MPRRAEDRAPIRRATCEHSTYSAEELEYLKAVDRYCMRSGRRCLAATEYLAVARDLGYRREPSPPTG